MCQEIIQLADEIFHSRDKLDDTLGNESHTIVLSVGGTFGNNVGNVSNNVVECELLLFYLFRDEADVGLCLQGTFKSDVRGRARPSDPSI